MRTCETCAQPIVQRANEYPGRWAKRRFCSRACIDYGNTRGRKMPSRSGANHFWWKGGITPLRKHIRNSLEARAWAKAVKERDNYTCQDCGKRGGKLASDHIQPWSLRPDLRYELSNGRTLCWPCHRKTPTYGNKAIYRRAA